MANLKDIRNRIKSVKSIQQVTKAMKMVAAAKMRRAQENMEQARPYSSRVMELIQSLLPDVDRSLLSELEVRDIKRVLFVVITADRGMAGAFNTNVLKVAQNKIDKFSVENIDIVCIGKKSSAYFKNKEYNVIGNYIDFWNELDYNFVMTLGLQLVGHYTDNKVDAVECIYNKFINVAKQEVISDQLLPLTIEEKPENINVEDKLYEPSKEAVISTLVPKFLNTQIWQYLLESFASEQAARMLAMENATTNAQDMIKDLTLQFNKARQTAITTEMLEIVSGAEALN